MALVCPVGHPVGVGTPFCRLCGRTYLESGGPPVLVEERPAPVVPQARQEPVVSPFTEVYELPPVPEEPRHLAPPAATQEPAHEPAHHEPAHHEPAHHEPADEEPPVERFEVVQAPVEPVPVVERRVMVLTAVATFVGGLVAGGGAVAFLA